MRMCGAGWASPPGLDLTLRRDAAGREYLPADFTKAIRSYSKAIELDGSDHRNYLNLASMLSWAMSRQEQSAAGLPRASQRHLQSLHFRVPCALVLTGAEGRLARCWFLPNRWRIAISPRVLDSLRTGRA